MRKRVRLTTETYELNYEPLTLSRTCEAAPAEVHGLHAHGKLQLRHITCMDGKGRMIKVRNEGGFAAGTAIPRKVLETLVRLTCNPIAPLHVQDLHAFGEHEFADIT